MADDPPEAPIRRKRPTRGAPPAAKVKTEPAPTVSKGRLRRNADPAPDDVEYRAPAPPDAKPEIKKPAARKPSARKPAAKAKKPAEKAPATYASSSDEASEESDDDLRPVEVTAGDHSPTPPDTLEAEVARSRADQLFSVDPAKDSEELLVIQFPTSLPASLARRPTKRPRSDSQPEDPDDVYDEVQRLRPGKIGTLQLLKSGDVRLVLGGETFDVDRGLRSSMAQQIVAIDPQKEELCVVGDVGKKLICTTHVEEGDWFANYDELIAKMDREVKEAEDARANRMRE